MCDWRKLPRRVTSRPEIEISDKRFAFSSQTSSIEPSYKTGPKQVKMSISPIAQGFLKKFRVQNVALTARRPKHPCLVWCNGIFLYETFSRLIPRDSNWAHHMYISKSISQRGILGQRRYCTARLGSSTICDFHHTTWQTCLKYTQLFDFGLEISGYTSPTLYPADAA